MIKSRKGIIPNSLDFMVVLQALFQEYSDHMFQIAVFICFTVFLDFQSYGKDYPGKLFIFLNIILGFSFRLSLVKLLFFLLKNEALFNFLRCFLQQQKH